MKVRQIRWMSIALAFVCLAIALPQFVARDRRHLVAGVAFLCGAALYVFHALRRPTDADEGTSKVQVFFDESRITARYGNGERRSMTWDDLVRVGITTTDEGPAVDDVFWGLHSQEGVEIVYPSEAIGAQALLGAMQSRLKDFNNEAVIRAMGSTGNDRFVVWQAAAAAES